VRPSRTRALLGIATVFPLLLAAGCASQPAATTETRPVQSPAVDLAGTSWKLVDLGGTPTLPGVEVTLEFPEAGKASGRASCNRFMGSVEISGTSIKFGPLAATKMACIDDAANAQEVRYLDALQKAERFAFDGSALRIDSTGTERPLRFVRK
jgi:heat shock protein HslJ